MIELHPRLDIRNLKIKQNKIILGSFPIWSLTQREDTQSLKHDLKRILNKKKEEFPFFYGSSTNKFWIWYKEYIDDEIVLGNIESIKNSIERNEIGLTDVILSCKRKNQSALDKDLSQRVYNHDFILYPKEGQILKILCTSKGVLNEMLLNNAFFKLHKKIKINVHSSIFFQNELIEKIGGNINCIQNSIFIELLVEDGGIIQCLATPSPGSPFRKLVNFGFTAGDLDSYLSKYLHEAFNWFKS